VFPQITLNTGHAVYTPDVAQAVKQVVPCTRLEVVAKLNFDIV
jgi:hypothetical protein